MQAYAAGERHRPPRQRGKTHVSRNQSESEEELMPPAVPIRAPENKRGIKNRAFEKKARGGKDESFGSRKSFTDCTQARAAERSRRIGETRETCFAPGARRRQCELWSAFFEGPHCEGSAASSQRETERETCTKIKPCQVVVNVPLPPSPPQSDVSGTGDMFAGR